MTKRRFRATAPTAKPAPFAQTVVVPQKPIVAVPSSSGGPPRVVVDLTKVKR
jgi:hypothetical protein